VLELVDRLRRQHGLAVVTALHDLTMASRFADRLMLLAAGRVVALGHADQVLTEEVLSRYYRTPVSVMAGPDGGVVVLPLRTDGGDRSTRSVCGPTTDHRTGEPGAGHD
jgi:iron complex transport system ATP-binding protein